jgi:hypothetical protein
MVEPAACGIGFTAMSERLSLDRPRSAREIVSATARLYRAFPLLFPTLALAVEGPYLLAVLAITGHGPLGARHTGFEESLLTQLLSYGLVTPLISALHIHALTAVGEGARPRIGAVAMRGLRVLPVVAAAEIVASIATYLGFLAFVVPGIVLALRWAVVAQAAAIEREGWLPALRSSAGLTGGHYGHVAGVILIVGIPIGALSVAANLAAPGDSPGAGSVIVGVALHTIFASVVALTTALLYFDLRARLATRRRAEREQPHLRDLDSS